MSDDLTSEVPVDLDDIAAALARMGFEHTVDDDGDQVLVTLSDDRSLGADGSRELAVRVHDSGSGAPLLTFSASYEFAAPASLVADVRTATAVLTRFLVLGHFEMDDDTSLHLRYSMLADGPLSDALLFQLIGLLDHQQLHFGDYLEAVCSGSAPVEILHELVQRGEAADPA